MNNKVRELLINDTFSQYYRQMPFFVTEKVKKEREERTKKVMKCDHLFVLLKEGERITGFHSSDSGNTPHSVECVHCGLTNKFMCIEEAGLMTSYDDSGSTHETHDSQLFRQIFANSYYRGGKGFNNDDLNLISDIPIKTNHPGLLYEMANLIVSGINPTASLNEIFSIMLELHNLETRDEKLRLRKLKDAGYLINRYYEIKKNNALKKVRSKR